MNSLRETAYRIDPVLWVNEVLGLEPAAWQAEYLRAPLGASILALTARQVGKTTAAAWGIAHFMCFTPVVRIATPPRVPKPCGRCAMTYQGGRRTEGQ
jgi:hypothetical protein